MLSLVRRAATGWEDPCPVRRDSVRSVRRWGQHDIHVACCQGRGHQKSDRGNQVHSTASCPDEWFLRMHLVIEALACQIATENVERSPDLRNEAAVIGV